MRLSVLQLLVSCTLLALVAAWTKEDHEIFRLRDEIEIAEGAGVTFYDFVGVKPSASQDEINKAYRKKSRQMHPDKVKQSFIASKGQPRKSRTDSKKPGVHVRKGPSQREIDQAVKQAGERMTRLGLVAKILRGEGKDRYDHFLANGFPRWRGTGYYYSRFRPGLGTVLLGLFVMCGGVFHYLALRISWTNNREFVGRYIREARRSAWGDESGIGGIPGLDGISASVPAATAESESAMSMNRRQKRMAEKESRKEKAGKTSKGGRASGAEMPPLNVGPTGTKRRVVAENGKVLVVDSTGNVYLEEEEEDGTKQEFLLDMDEIPPPTIRDTALYRLPAFLYLKLIGRFTGHAIATDKKDGFVDEDDPGYEIIENDIAATAEAAANGAIKKRNKKAGKA